MSEWFVEKLYPSWRQTLAIATPLHQSATAHQRIALFENPQFGRVLTLNDVVQTTERDEFVYHEMMAHVPILAHGGARRVLIIGGGDGGLLEEVLKHRTVAQATMVEIDPGVVEFSRRHLPMICGQAFDDPRTDLVIADGLDFVTRPGETYHVILVDSTDPIGPGVGLYTERFYAGCKQRLEPSGVLVTQNGVPFLQGGELSGTVAALRPLFEDVSCYLAAVPTYVGGFMALGWASDDPALRHIATETLRTRHATARFSTRYYSPEVHRGAFALPPFIADLVA
ncbi:MAG: polyamine aminopropyltransferase [Alphaproteobacteria bacterium]|nr:polyamine aminopropyltransferase [Alphaproteobacteria bacterium]